MLPLKVKVHELKRVKRTHSYRLILPSSNCYIHHSSLKRLKHFQKVFYYFSFSFPPVNI